MGSTTLKMRQIAGGLDGWIPAEETWTYASADDPTFTFTVAADVTTKYSAGMKIKLTQGTVKYFIITAISAFTGGNTTITVYGGTDYDLASSAISANYYSMVKSPFGFPMSPAKWTVTTSVTDNQTQNTPTQNTWYNLGSTTISIPIGIWYTGYSVSLYGDMATGAGTYFNIMGTLSTANNSESDATFTSTIGAGAATSDQRSVRGTVCRVNVLTLTSKTSYYLNVKTPNAGVGNIQLAGSSGGTATVRAVCAYL